MKMKFLLFGIFLIEFCSAFGCRREKERIKELFHQKRELQIERDELAAEKGRFCFQFHFTCGQTTNPIVRLVLD